jgi:hypothetical protein
LENDRGCGYATARERRTPGVFVVVVVIDRRRRERDTVRQSRRHGTSRVSVRVVGYVVVISVFGVGA